LCILQISTKVLKIPNVVLTDQNASSDYVRFLSPLQIESIDFDMVFARNWNDQSLPIKWRKKAMKCAEVLVPERVPPELIIGAYIPNKNLMNIIMAYGINEETIQINSDLFFL
jgi:hypothetical protein